MLVGCSAEDENDEQRAVQQARISLPEAIQIARDHALENGTDLTNAEVVGVVFPTDSPQQWHLVFTQGRFERHVLVGKDGGDVSKVFLMR